MKNVNCEDFEREFQEFSSDGLNADRLRELELHQRECPHCRQYDLETSTLRQALQSIPLLEEPPYFLANLKREINRQESGLRKPQYRSNPLPRFLTVSTGFAVAIIASLVFLQPAQRNIGLSPSTGPTAGTEQLQPDQNMNNPSEELLLEDPSSLGFASEDGILDTATHRLPEPAGQDSIPIPVEDDYWKLNQVSTTPDNR